jgi:hypothetical protein
MNTHDTKSYLTNALSYWELRRIVYNAVLGAIVLGYFVANLPTSLQRITPDVLFGVFILAVLANKQNRGRWCKSNLLLTPHKHLIYGTVRHVTQDLMRQTCTLRLSTF